MVKIIHKHTSFQYRDMFEAAFLHLKAVLFIVISKLKKHVSRLNLPLYTGGNTNVAY